MEGDDEWEDHLIVSYTPPQGCERTLREEQLERIVQNTKLELAQVAEKSGNLKILESAKGFVPPGILKMISGLVESKLLQNHHKYWNFICRDRRSPAHGILAAVGAHVFHQNDQGEWTMFPEPGDKGYSGDVRFVLQWKQFDFVFINLDHVAVYQNGQFIKRLAHKYAGNSSFGVQSSARFVYFMESGKLHRVDETLESQTVKQETWAAYEELVNLDVSESDEYALVFKRALVLGKEGSETMERFERSLLSGAVRFITAERILLIQRPGGVSGNQAVLFDRKLQELHKLDLHEGTVAMSKMRLLKRMGFPTFVLVNATTAVILLAVSASKIYFVSKQDTQDDTYSFACLGQGILVTGGFHRLFCLKTNLPKFFIN